MSSGNQRNIWRAIQNAVVNRQKSKTYMKQMIPAIVSSIMKKRIDLPEENFTTRKFKGVPYKVLKSNITDPELQSLQKTIKSITDLFEKECLKNAYLLICSKQDPDQVYECYTLNYDYKKIENIDDKRSALKGKLTEQTIGLLSSINGLNSQNSFQLEHVLLRLVLTHYNNDKVLDYYEPRNLECVVDEKPKLLEAEEESTESPYLSMLTTGFHTLKCFSDHQLEEFMNSIAQSESNLCITIDEVTETYETFIRNKNNEMIIDDAPEIEMTKEDKQQTGKTPKTNIYYDSMIKANPEQFKCSCGIQWRIPYIEAVQCKTCLTFHHCICVGQFKAEDVPNPFECYECNNKILSINLRQFYIMCLMIVYMCFANTFPNDLYYKLSEQMQDYMVKKLETVKILQKAPNGYTIDTQQLEKMLASIETKLGSCNVINSIPNSMELK